MEFKEGTMEFKEGTKVKKIYDSFISHRNDGDLCDEKVFKNLVSTVAAEVSSKKGYVRGYIKKWIKNESSETKV